MYDPITLDQLRAFVTVADQGSFSAAARKLKRVQSAVSTAMANLESQLGVAIWDRSHKVPKLTDRGQALLAAARRVLGEVDALRALSSGMSMGVEAQVSLCIDALFPLPALLALCTSFAKAFPTVDLRIDTQVMSAVGARVLDGRATLGVVSPLGATGGLERTALAPIRMVPVVSSKHPLAALKGPIPDRAFADHIQIVLSEREDTGVPDQAVLSPRTWRVADLHTKHQLLCAGLGWGNLPEQVASADLKSKKLVRIRPAAWGEEQLMLTLFAVYRPDTAFGPAHRWILAQLGELCVAEASALRAPSVPSEKRKPAAR